MDEGGQQVAASRLAEDITFVFCMFNRSMINGLCCLPFVALLIMSVVAVDSHKK